MRKRNLFSKIVAGIGALAMVATMLPAMAMPAKAALTGTVNVTQPEHAKIYAYPTSSVATKLAKPSTLVEATNDGAGTYTLDIGEKYVIVPDAYYEYENGPRVKYTNNQHVTSSSPEKNEYSPTSYIWTVPTDLLDSPMTLYPLEVDPATPITVYVTVYVDQDDIEVYDRSFNPNGAGKKFDSNKREYKITRRVNDAGTADVPSDDFPVYYVNDYPIIPTMATDSKTSLDNTWAFEKAGARGGAGAKENILPASYSSPIVITAASKTAFDMTVDAYSNASDEHEEVQYNEHDLVDMVKDAGLPAAGEGNDKYDGETEARTGFDNDVTSYISLYRLNNKLLDAAAYATKDLLPDEIEQSVEFVLNVEDIYRLYAWGIADGTKKNDNVMEPTFNGADPDKSDNRTSGLRNLTYKYVDIHLGRSQKKDVGVKWENGMDNTTDTALGVASNYTWSYVFRDVNGKRFDSKETLQETYAWRSGDPDEYPTDIGKGYSGVSEKYVEYDEGETVEFTLLIDPMWKTGPNWNPERDVYVYAYDSTTQSPRRNMIKYNEETGVFTFTVGREGDYRIVAENIVRKTSAELGILRNIPESDALFGNHTENLGWVNRFYQYQTPFNSNAGNNCNVRNPRYQFFIAADEDDAVMYDLVAFAIPGATGTTDQWSGHNFPVGEHKFKLRFGNAFNKTLNEAAVHGIFNDDLSDDRYALGADGKVTLTVDGTATTLTPDDDGLYTVKIEAGKVHDLRVEGVVPAYRVSAANTSAYNFVEVSHEMNREASGNFISSVPEGETYSFKLDLRNGVVPGPDFKVMLVHTGDQWDHDMDDDGTVITPDADGVYSFDVFNDTEIVIYGLGNSGAFSDIAGRSDEEQAAISWLKNQGILGFEDGTYRPDASTKRAEFVRMLYVLNNGTAGTASFTDTASHWANAEIGWGADQKIVNGYPNGSFMPDQPISRAEVAQVIWKLAGSKASAFTAPFSDVPQNAWFAQAINWNYSESIVNGIGDNLYAPNAPITRAHMALILYRSKGQF